MKPIAGQSVEELGGAWSVLVRQKNDHIALDRLLRQVPLTTGQEQQELLNRLCRLVFSHAFAEEAVLWPALRRAVPEGEVITSRVEREHQQITELVARLESAGPTAPRRLELIDRTTALLRQDVRDEEDDLLPRLQTALAREQLRRLGVLWEVVRRTAPTRAHPVVSRRPPGDVCAALPLSALDRTREGLDHTSRRTPPPLRRAFGAAGRGLAAAAHGVERLPVMRLGEPADTHARDGARS